MENWQETLEKATNEMCQSLNRFGCDEILKLLIEHSSQDIVVRELLAKFPSIAAVGDFLATLPIIKQPKPRRSIGRKRRTTSKTPPISA